MSTLVFKGEAWTLRTAPTHKVLGASSNGVEVLGYFLADEPSEVTLIMEMFKDEYEAEYGNMLAVNVKTQVGRSAPHSVLRRA